MGKEMPESGDHDANEQTQSYVMLAKGTAIGHYRIIEKIGAGGMGEVYLAEDTELKRRVALKFLPARYADDREARTRFTREAQAAAALGHPNIVHIYEVAEFQGRPFFAMELVEGRSLRDVIKKDNLQPSRALDLACQICEGLIEAHRVGVVHRDIKPANILIDNQGRARLVDFGLARIEGAEEITRTGSTMGTVGYMSPEQIKAEPVDHRSDIFSAGVVIYEMITGRQPFRRENTAATLLAIINDQPEPLVPSAADVSPRIQQIVDKALAKDRDKRYQNVEELLTDLKQAQHKTPAPAPSWFRRYLSLATAVIVVACIALLLFHDPSRDTLFKWLGLDAIPTKKHLAVLPLANIGEGPANQAFCDGLMETITSKLTQLEQYQGMLWVIPSSEVRQREVTSAGLARQIFGATLAVTGSVQRLGEQVRITLNLVDTKTTRQLRSMVIDDSLVNILALQDSLVIKLAEMLDIQLQPEKQRIITAGGTSSAMAYDLYLQGQGFLQRHWEEWGSGTQSIDTSIVLFQRAIDEDPEYAEPYAALGQAYWRKYEFVKEPRWSVLAQARGRHAIELNDKLPSTHVALGLVYKGTGQYEKAVQTFRRALDLNPANHEANQGLAASYEALNDFARAEDAYRHIITLRPDIWHGYRDLAFFYIYQGRNEEALRQLQALLTLQPEGVGVWNDIGGLYYYLGQRDEARRAWERSIEIKPNYAAYQNLGALYQLTKDYPAAAGTYEKALALDDRDYLVWINLASVYNLIPGNGQKASAAYRQAIDLAKKLRTVNPRDPMLLSHLADCYAMTGDSTRAMSAAKLALSHGPENIYVLTRIGIVCEVLGHRDQALDCLGRALARGFLAGDLESFPELDQLRADDRYEVILAGIMDTNSANADSGTIPQGEEP